MIWKLKSFEELNVNELYAVIQLREDVFIVEQNCPFLDCDGKDPQCWHLMGWADGKLAAYTRIVPPGVIFDTASIGRVVTSREFRRHGIGKELMEKSIEEAENLGYKNLTIGAQYYLLKFYQSFGFKEFGEIYLEDGIEHVHMKR
ncbi:GNAT family N-acetyltransferase [Solitalea canadensis]|uniref:Putative acyltransferase n=1 Tax=Solitalea canadensis (strain ATCC 29591 / DSM 3403 / JCM 21819 / LMG 8368 / NBRC 15130 / NCIMB 12057 / USAM 9D) TaxID=929556 RepID=H8KPK3_SOLCM|nr:GNAT family N-acetyltransferase [Solitalea canadensis]AFD05901.1 putative acyltransferase [Solitalea canadensis DSM 3403]